MRNQADCIKDAKAFLNELVAYWDAKAQPKARGVQASEQTRQWCKDRGYAQFVGPYMRGYNFKKNGWAIMAKGLAWLAENNAP